MKTKDFIIKVGDKVIVPNQHDDEPLEDGTEYWGTYEAEVVSIRGDKVTVKGSPIQSDGYEGKPVEIEVNINRIRRG
jgi:hypothetical protein